MSIRLLATTFWAVAAVWSAPIQAETLRFATWNITNLHHETGVPLRAGAAARDDIDYQRLREFAEGMNLDIVALQEIGSPAALDRVLPESEYHLVMSSDYATGAENAPLTNGTSTPHSPSASLPSPTRQTFVLLMCSTSATLRSRVVRPATAPCGLA